MASRTLMTSMTRGYMAAAASRRVAAPMAQRTFQTSAPALAHKESQNHPDNTADPEKHKQDLLAKQKQGKGHWKPELASDSEEAVKADRSSASSVGEDVKNLQDRTKSSAEESSKSGTSMRDGL